MLQKAAAYLMMLRDDAVLLLLRQNTGYMDGMWDFPAGHVEPGEAAGTAVLREAFEEVGVTVAPGDAEFAHVMHRNHGDAVYFGVYFTCTSWSGEPRLMEPDKCAAVRWFPCSALPDNMVPFSRNVIASHLPRQTRYSEWGW